MEKGTAVLLFPNFEPKGHCRNIQKHAKAPEKFGPVTSFSFRGCPCPSVSQVAGLGALDRMVAADDGEAWVKVMRAPVEKNPWDRAPAGPLPLSEHTRPVECLPGEEQRRKAHPTAWERLMVRGLWARKP